jgi:DNA-binding SARP family transcriptional activator
VHGLAAPPEAGPAWPWPLKIATFGRFELIRDDAVLALAGKTQKKPLELLKALIALGSHGIDRQRLADFLWADAEPDAAAAALDMATLRLRKLITLPDAIRIEDGKVRLDAAQVWVDVWAFDRDVEALQGRLHVANPDSTQIAALGERLLARYRGPSSENEEPRRWLLAARDRWRNRSARSLCRMRDGTGNGRSAGRRQYRTV